MAGDEKVARLAAQPVAHARRRIGRLQVRCRREFREGIAGSPERQRRLAGAKLATVPHRQRLRGPSRRGRSALLGLRFTSRRQRPPRVVFVSDRFGVVNEEELQWCIIAQSCSVKAETDDAGTPFRQPGCEPSADFPTVAAGTS